MAASWRGSAFVLRSRRRCDSWAARSWRPVVTSAVGGIPEIVVEGGSGFLIAPGDGAALAERLEALVAAPELRAAMGREGRRIVEGRFDAARNTAHTLDVIVDLCRRREAARAGTPAGQRHA